jgi:hypothetical protein
MFIETPLVLRQPRPQPWAKASVTARAKRAERGTPARPGSPSSSKSSNRRKPAASAASAVPEGWARRLREQSNNLARAVQMLEQALSMVGEPKSHALAQAECLRGAGLLTLVAASELLVVAGWFEADQAVNGGTLEL